MKIRIPVEVLSEIQGIAKARNAENRKSGQKDGLVDKTKGSVEADIEGAIGEYAVSQALDLEWDGDFRTYEDWKNWRSDGHDVCGLEVRTTRHPGGCLIVQPGNDPDRPYVLALLSSDNREVSIPGWAWGYEVKKDEFWKEHWPRPTYAMEQSFLRPIERLKRLWQGRWIIEAGGVVGDIQVLKGRVIHDEVFHHKTKLFLHLLRWAKEQPGFSATAHPLPTQSFGV